jgi:ABC-type transport system involved in multi-copper enzyme maturation permease subunit
VTSAPTRVLVLARYGFEEAWSSKITIALFAICLFVPIVFLIGIYLANNPLARAMMGGDGPRNVAIDHEYFLIMMQVHCWIALPLASWVAPRLISFDMSDNALPILLSHPVSRFGYVLGKFLALSASLSVVTWVPCLFLFAYEGYASPVPWAAQNLQIAGGMFAGSLLWVALLSLLALAMSSWVKWRVVATGAIFAAILVPAGMGAIVSAVLRTRWGLLLNLPVIMQNLWQRMLGAPDNVNPQLSLPTFPILAMLALVLFVCAAMLNARIRAREVVRG